MRTIRLGYIFCMLLSSSVVPASSAAQWLKAGGSGFGYPRCLAAHGTTVYAGALNGIYRASAESAGPSTFVSGLGARDVTSLLVSGSAMFAATWFGNVYVSIDSGATWSAGSPLPPVVISSLAAVRGSVFAGTFDWNHPRSGGVYRSTDLGTSWTAVAAGLPPYVVSLHAHHTTLFCGTLGGIYRSTDEGVSWSPAGAGLPNVTGRCFTSLDSTLFVGTEGAGMYRSTNGGAQWSEVNNGFPAGSNVYSLATDGSNLYAGTENRGLFLSTDNGESWNDISGNLAGDEITGLVSAGGKLYAALFYSGIWSRPFAEVVSSAASSPLDSPAGFRLFQNYPNPFNPQTTISYAVPERSRVTLTVFNALGECVASLVDAEVDAGTHSVAFDASRLASGIYWYRIRAGGFVETRKLTVLK